MEMVFDKGEVIFENDNVMLIKGDCFDVMKRMADAGKQVDNIICSPPYNSNRKAGKSGTNQNRQCDTYHYIRYDVHVDNMTTEEYKTWSINLFKLFDKILKPNGVILYNLSFGSESPSDDVIAIAGICEETCFEKVDRIVWKKPTAFPISSSPNKLTRICEDIYVMTRKTERLTFKSNKKVTSLREKTGQKAYETLYNFIEAKNNDGSCPYNKATYSTELCTKLMDIYVQEDSIVLDPFSGSGTTIVACLNKGLKGLGIELSENQCNFAKDRILKQIGDTNGNCQNTD